jgi:hypothetical protein
MMRTDFAAATAASAETAFNEAPRVAAFDIPRRALPIRPAAALQWAVLLLVISQLGRIPFLDTGDGDAPLMVNELVLMVLFVVGALACAQARSFRIDGVAVAALCFATVGGVGSMLTYTREFLNGREIIVSLAYLGRWVFYFGIYLYVINCISKRDVWGVWKTLETMLLIFAVFGMFQAAFLPNFAFMLHPNARVYIDFDPQGHRLVSTILEPNVAGMILLVGLLVHLSLVAAGRHVPRWKMWVLFVALMLTVSRSSLVGLVIGCMTIALIAGMNTGLRRIAITVSALVLLCLPLIISAARQYGKFDLGEGTSAAARYEAWLQATNMFLAHPIIGIGFNTFAPMMHRYSRLEALGAGRASSEGGLLFVATLTGLLGLAIFVVMLALIIRRCHFIWGHPESDGDSRALALGTVATIYALCAHSVFVNTLFATFTMELMWVLAGLTFVLAKDLTTRVPARNDPSPIRLATTPWSLGPTHG